MSEQLTLSAETRERAGKGASRAMRRTGRVPAVIYGDRQEPLAIHVEEKALMKMLNTGFFMNSVVMVDVGGAANRTLPKDVQFHPVTERPLHVDFLRISEHAKVTVGVPVRFTNEDASPGLKRGGVLNVVRHELELTCDASEMPDEVVIDLAGLDIGDSIHISAVSLPKGTKSVIEDRDFTIATVVAPSGVKAEAAEAAEAAAAAEGIEEVEPGEVPTVGEEEAAPEGEAEA
ncbi:50S ribosomal protein L25/general stress protein Ctc [Allosphingosinicella sp.]|uniref:50S ribosomal protein L25/general stress protein Ctc n=1 Tax=Allosphingosinicella sp. TaxID=2823234 RepID=UPI002FC12999